MAKKATRAQRPGNVFNGKVEKRLAGIIASSVLMLDAVRATIDAELSALGAAFEVRERAPARAARSSAAPRAARRKVVGKRVAKKATARRRKVDAV